MRVLVIAATGVIGSQLVPQLRQRGHEVIGTSRSADKAERLRALGAQDVGGRRALRAGFWRRRPRG